MENFINEDTDPKVQDILRSSTDASPQEAVNVINRAEHYDMHPDEYNEMKGTLDPEVKIQERVPAEVSPAVKDYMSKSSKHAEVAGNEIGALEKVSKQASFIWYNLTEKHVLEKEIQELNNKDRTSDLGLEDHEKDYLNNLYEQQQEETEAFGLEGYEQVPGQVAGVINDMFQAVTDNKAIIAGSVATGAGIGFFTPFGPATALAGAGAGLGYGVTAALVKDAYFRIADSTYGELSRMKGDDGQPLTLSRDEKDNISMGVGGISAVLEGITGKVLTGGLKKLLVPKTAIASIIKSPALKTATSILGHATKSAITSGGEEVSAEVVAILGENFAKGDQTVEGLRNAMMRTGDDILNNPETQKRLKMTAVVGAAAGGTIATVTAAPATRRIKKGYELSNAEIEKQRVQNATIQSAIKSLNNQNDVMNLAKLSLDTEMKKLSPEQMSELRKDMFTKAGYEDKVWFNDADMTTIEENNPELATQIREMDVTESSNSETSSPVGLEVHQFMDLVDETPTVAEYARLNPEAPNPLESRNVIERFKEAEAKRQEIFASLGPEEKLSPEQVLTLESLDKTVEEGVRVTGEEGYLDAPTFTKEIEAILPEKQVKSYNEAQLNARVGVAEQLVKEFEAKEIRIENKVVKLNEKIEKESQNIKIKNDLRVVEHFKYDKEAPTSTHKRKGYSKLAIDPKYLPENLKEAYTTDAKLVKRKVFVEGGITLEESAALAGVTSGEQLLKILANTPTKKEMLAARRKKSAEIRKQVQESRAKTVDIRRDKIFDDLNKAHLREMKFMKEHEWPATKQGIKKIVLPLPKIEELNNTARKAIAKTKVGHLNPRQFNAGERSLQRKSANHILKNEVEQAFATKEKAMMNAELTRESLKARSRVNDAKDLVKRIESKKGIATFKKANMLPKVNEILDLFDLKGSKPKGIRQESYFEYLASLDEEGKSIIVPESLNDIRQRGTDLTTEQYLRVTDRLKTLEHQAKTKNKLLKRSAQREKFNTIQTEEAVVSKAIENLESHPDYDVKRLKDVGNKNSKGFFQRMSEGFEIASSMLTNFKNVATQLDQEALGGEHYNNIAQPMVEAETLKRTKLSGVVKQIKKIAKKYGNKKFTKALNEFVEIPEFENYSELGNGTMAKSDLWMLFAYMGDPQAVERIGNFMNHEGTEAMSVETVKRVLDTHLDENDAKIAQDFVNIFKSFEQETMELHERTTGVTPTMVKGIPIEHRGKVYDGGYVPNNYLNTSVSEKLERFLEVLGDKENAMFGGKDDGKLYSRLRAAEQTDQGRLIDRTGSSQPLDTNFRNFLHAYEEHIHDLAYREAGTDVLKLLKNPAYSDAMISTVGMKKYKMMGSAIIETVGNSNSEGMLNPFSEEFGAVEKVVKHLEQGFNIAALGFKLKSVLMQPLSFGAATLRMGPTGGRYLTKSLGQVLGSIGKLEYDKMFDAAAEINPDIVFNKDSVDDTLVKSTFDFIDKTKRSKVSQKLATLKRGQQFLNDFSMLGLKKLDIHIKVAATMASYTQFISGDVKNFPMSKLDTMSEAEIDIAAKKYAKQMADLSLTTSAIIDKNALEKISYMRMFTRFYTDLRSQLNTTTSQARKLKSSAKRATTAFREGDITKSLSHAKSGAIDASALLVVHSLSQMYIGMLYDEETPISELSEVRDMDDFKNFMGSTASFVLGAPVRGVIGATPVARDIQFALGSTRRKKSVRVPLINTFSEMTTAITGIADLLEGYDLSKDQKKALLSTASYIGGGIPVNGPEEILEMLDESEIFGDAGAFVRGETKRLASNIKKFIEENPKETETIEALKEIQTDLVPAMEQETKHIIPEDALEVLKTNKWDDLDPETGAAGIYQFTEERWNEISEANPDLGLTDDGRVSKDSREQEKAMNWSLDQNTKGLIAYQLDVNNSTLYGAHRFGLDDFTAVMLSNDNEKLTNIVEDKTLFKGFKTVKQVKSYVKKQTN